MRYLFSVCTCLYEKLIACMPACSVNCLLQGSISCGSICTIGPLSGIVFIFFRLRQSKLFDLNACMNISSVIVFESVSLEI